MLKAVALALALTGTGCAMPVATPPDVYHADTSFTPAERESIIQGGIFLAYHTHHSFSVVFDREPGTPIARHTIVRGPNPASDPGLGFYDGPTDSINLDMPAIHADVIGYPEYPSSCAAHELGHSLGLSHHVGPGLMNPGSTLVLEWTPDDQLGCMSDKVCK